MKLSKSATREYTVMMRKRYRAMKSKLAKGRVLDEFCTTTHLERKHAIKVLRSTSDPLQPTGRKPKYAVAVEPLRKIWILFDQPCSKLLHPVLGEYIASYEKHEGKLAAGDKALLLRMSPSTIDRLLRPYRLRTSLWRGRGSSRAKIKQEIPVRLERWEERGPGWFETDSVAHCGGSMAGSFAYTLTFTDTDTQWTELRAVWNRGGHATTLRVAEIEKSLPFDIAGVNSDNGSEFINWHLVNYFKDRSVRVIQTRSRPYHKNDNARVEQKNGSHVRTLLGYDRFDDPNCIENLNEILILHSYWTNLYRPCMKLISKIKEGHRYKKIYDQPQTPAQRLLARAETTRKTRSKVRAMFKEYDCYELKCLINTKLDSFFEQYVQIDSNRQAAPIVDPAPSGAGPTMGAKSSKGNKGSSAKQAKKAHRKKHLTTVSSL